jgi:hypothetical protein
MEDDNVAPMRHDRSLSSPELTSPAVGGMMVEAVQEMDLCREVQTSEPFVLWFGKTALSTYDFSV